LNTTCDPFAVAVRILSQCDRSEKDLRQRLQRRDFSQEAVDHAIERCREYGYINDHRFAYMRAASLARSGRAVGYKLLADLRQRGISPALAQEAVVHAENEIDSCSLIRSMVCRRYPAFSWLQATEKERRRISNWLLRRGFTSETVFSELKKITTDGEQNDQR